MNKNENQNLPINLIPNNIKYNIKSPININNQPNLILNKKNIDDDSLYNISYSSSKKQNNNNAVKVNNYISNEKQKINNYMQDKRIVFTLKMLGLNKYYMNFFKNELNFEGLLALSNNDMELMDIPKNCQKIIRTFILDYLQFGNLYTLEELKQYFIKRNYSKEYLRVKRSNSYNFQGNKAKKIKNNTNSQIKLRCQKQNQYNNYEQEFDKRNNNFNIINDNNIINNNLKINKSDSLSLKDYYNIYSKINMNSININNIENKINNQYIMNYNNFNDYINKNTLNDVNDLIINKNKNNYFSPLLDNFNREAFEQRNFNINRMKHYSKVNKNMKKNLKQNQIKTIPKHQHSNSSKIFIQNIDKILKTHQKKKYNTNKLDYKLSNNMNDNIIINKLENRYKRYHSFNNNNKNIIQNDNSNITDNNYYKNTTNTTKENYANNYYNLLNNNFFDKNPEYDNYTLMMTRSSSLNPKTSKIKMLKIKQIQEVNQILNNNSESNGKNLYSFSAEKKDMQTNNFNNYNINNSNFINKDNNDSISLNNNLESNNFKIQNMKLKNKNIYYRNIDNNGFNNNYNNFTCNQLSYNLNTQNNITNNNIDINEIPDYPGKNNNIFKSSGKHKFHGIMTNSENNSRIKRLEMRCQESQAPKKLFNNNSQKNLNIINNSNNNLNNINSINFNDDNINFIENTQNNNYINKNNNLSKSKNKKIKLRQNNSNNYFIKSFEDYYKTTQNFYNGQLQKKSNHISHSSNEKDKFNQLVNDTSYNLINKDKKNPEEMNAEELIKAMDEDSARIGLVIADLYRTLVMAMKRLPDMELHTDYIDLTVNNQGISTFVVDLHRCDGYKGFDDRCEDDQDRRFADDEEGMIYDEID